MQRRWLSASQSSAAILFCACCWGPPAERPRFRASIWHGWRRSSCRFIRGSVLRRFRFTLRWPMSEKAPIYENWMHPIRWVPGDAGSLLDIGCNVGELLTYCRAFYPKMRLCGVDVNRAAVDKARRNLPDAELHAAGVEELPFLNDSFDCVTCIEVLEHIPANSRRPALAEMRRVLRRGGRLVLRVPHAGLFAFLDSNNLRFRMPRIYRALLKNGRRDAGYARGSDEIVWHHHFTREELGELLGDGWE